MHYLNILLAGSEGFSVTADISGKYADSTPYRMVLLEVIVKALKEKPYVLQNAFCEQLALTSERMAPEHLQQFSRHVLASMVSCIAVLYPLA